MSGKPNVTRLEITRPSAYIAMLVPHRIFVDGKKVGQVRNGKTQTIEVAPGQHEIYVKQSMFVKTDPLTLDCAPNETIRLQVTQIQVTKQALMGITGIGRLFLMRRKNLLLERLP